MKELTTIELRLVEAQEIVADLTEKLSKKKTLKKKRKTILERLGITRKPKNKNECLELAKKLEQMIEKEEIPEKMRWNANWYKNTFYRMYEGRKPIPKTNKKSDKKSA